MGLRATQRNLRVSHGRSCMLYQLVRASARRRALHLHQTRARQRACNTPTRARAIYPVRAGARVLYQTRARRRARAV